MAHFHKFDLNGVRAKLKGDKLSVECESQHPPGCSGQLFMLVDDDFNDHKVWLLTTALEKTLGIEVTSYRWRKPK